MKNPLTKPFRLERNGVGGWVFRAADDGDLSIQMIDGHVIIRGIESIETYEERGHREERRVPSESFSIVFAAAQGLGIKYDRQGDDAIRIGERNYRRLQAELAAGSGGARHIVGARRTYPEARTREQDRGLRQKAAALGSHAAPEKPAIKIPEPVYRAGAPEYSAKEAREFLAASLKSARLFFRAADAGDATWEACAAGELLCWDTSCDLKTDHQHLLLADCYVVFSAHYKQPSQRGAAYRIVGPSILYCIDECRSKSPRYVTLIHVPQFVSEFYRSLEPATFASLSKIATRHLPKR
jgi:hypothetical protein